MRRFWPIASLCVATLLVFYAAFWLWTSWRVGIITRPPIPFRRFERPYGMAPSAFRAFVAACSQAKVSPDRIGQTIGNDPRSKGYHLRDGQLDGADYTAAVDVGVDDLSSARREEFLRALGRHGFAAWYRSGPQWAGDEHVHAVFAGVPMKAQLAGQVRLWRREHPAQVRKWPRVWRRFWA